MKIKRPSSLDGEAYDFSAYARRALFRAYYLILICLVINNIPSYITNLTMFGVSVDQKSLNVVFVFLTMFSIMNYLLAVGIFSLSFIYLPPKRSREFERHMLYLAFTKISKIQYKKRYSYHDWHYWKRFYYRAYGIGIAVIMLTFILEPVVFYIYYACRIIAYWSSS